MKKILRGSKILLMVIGLVFLLNISANAIPINNPPIANAGPDQNVNEGGSVALNGFGSYDIDGDPISFLWTQTDGITVSLSNITIANPNFTAPEVPVGGDTLTFLLTITEMGTQDLLFATDSVNIFVQDINGGPAPVPEPSTMLLLGSGLVGIIAFRKKIKKS